jgi:aspartate aminotransferase
LLFNNPSNPTGMVYDAAEVAAVAAVLLEFPNVWVISDDIYDALGFSGTRTAHLLDTAPSLRDRLIIAHSVSKTYGMVGWRVGLLAGPKAILDGVLLLTSQSSTCVPFMAQAGAAEALSGDQTFLTDVLKTLQTKRDLLLAAVQRWGWECPVPEGAFYLFPQVTSLFGRTLGGTVIDSAATFAKVLLTEAHVAVVPGAAFGDAGAVRLSYGAKEAEIVTAIARIDALLAA